MGGWIRVMGKGRRVSWERELDWLRMEYVSNIMKWGIREEVEQLGKKGGRMDGNERF